MRENNFKLRLFKLDKQIPGNHSRYSFADYTAYFFELASNLDYAERLVDFGTVKEETVKRAKRAVDDTNIDEKQKIEDRVQIRWTCSQQLLASKLESQTKSSEIQ